MRIDPHVHFRDQEQSYKETIKHGLELAKQQGVDIVFDMPNTARLILTEKDVKERLKFVPKKERERYFLYIGATSNANQLKKAVKLVNSITQVIGIKMYAGKSTGDLATIEEEKQQRVYDILAENKYAGVIAVHCEKEKFMRDIFDPKKPFTHALARPNSAEIESIKDQIKFIKKANFKGNLHVCHVSCKKSVEIIDKARKDIRITCGVTPHHLYWDNSKLKGYYGLLYKTVPPLRSKKDVKYLQRYLREGKIDWIETDHAPHAIGEKLYGPYPSGYPSLYNYKNCVRKLLPSLGLSKKQIEDLTFHNIAKTFKIEEK